MSVKGLLRKTIRQVSLGGLNRGPIVLVEDHLVRGDKHNGKSEGYLYTLIGPR